jgi:putative restriction endonuclease
MADTYTLRDYLDITAGAARLQWEAVQRRVPRERQEDFIPVEALMCLAAMYVVDHLKHGGSSRAPRAPEPVPSLARLFVRKPTSILRKMGNLDGTFPRGGKWDVIAGARLRAGSSRMTEVYRRVLAGARAAGIGSDRLPDFLGLERGGELVLLGQDELDRDAVDSVVEDEFARWIARQRQIPEHETERLLLASVRIGQHRFAVNVMHNCGGACVFCEFSLGDGKSPTLLRASHIKPWRESSHRNASTRPTAWRHARRTTPRSTQDC